MRILVEGCIQKIEKYYDGITIDLNCQNLPKKIQDRLVKCMLKTIDERPKGVSIRLFTDPSLRKWIFAEDGYGKSEILSNLNEESLGVLKRIVIDFFTEEDRMQIRCTTISERDNKYLKDALEQSGFYAIECRSVFKLKNLSDIDDNLQPEDFNNVSEEELLKILDNATREYLMGM